MHRACLIIPFSLLLLGCPSDVEFHEREGVGGGHGPQISVTPEILDFGALGRDETTTATFTVSNVGEGDLEVDGIEISGTSTSFSILTPEEDLSFVLPPSAEEDIEVAFTPLGANEQYAQAVISSNDEDSALVAVDLYGEGLVPDLEIDPNPYDFGDTYIGCPHVGEVDLINVGYDELTIDTITMSGSAESFSLTSIPTLPLTLLPEEWTTVSVEFNPDADIEYSSVLQVTHDAPGGTDRGTASGLGIYAGDYTDTWEIPSDPPVDLLFSVDQSGSMDDDQASLGNNFANFISQLSNYTTDWRIIVANNDNGCNQGGILTSTTSGYINTFQTQVSAGGGWYTESLLTVAQSAIEATDSGECNQNFMRSDALLHIILVSDEPEQSSGSWSTYVTNIQNKKGSVANVKISAIAGDYPGGCGSAMAGTGYYEAVNATGGEFLSICSNWASMVETLADASIELSEYELSHTADPDTIVVRVNGSEVTSGWHYEESNNSVLFTNGIPEEGDTVRITYSAFANCD